jgi:two-component system, cell cycle sensor histidine kinase and response regulator CckA
MREQLRALLVAESEPRAGLILAELRPSTREVIHERVDRPVGLRDALDLGSWDVVICDGSPSSLTALDGLALVKKIDLDLPVVVILSEASGERLVIEPLRGYAQSFVPHDRLGWLSPIVERELGVRERRKRHDLEQASAEEALRQSELQLRHAQKMEAVGRLAGGVSHEFNNVLSVILSYGELMLGDLESEDPMRADVEEVCRAARRAADLTRQLLLFSRQQTFESKNLDVGEVLGGMGKILRRVLGEDVALSFVIAPSLGTVSADPRSLEQVVMNLASNARDAMPMGGKVVIEIRNLDVNEDLASRHPGLLPGPHVLLSVTDTGVGMDNETLTRAFEPFFTTKDQGKGGGGLGLSTVFGIVKQSGGSVWATSAPGKGTSVEICLPRVDSSP